MAVLILVGLCCFFYNVEVILAENSAMFRIITTIPAPAEAGKEIVFEVGITNTGIETWVSGEYSLFIKIYDANKNYLTETDKIRQFKDTAPGEVLTANISFDVPVDYSGTYHYSVGIEFEKEGLLSHYFILKILLFVPVPEVKKWTGNVQIGYQDAQAVESATSLNLRVVNLLPQGSYLRLSTSGQSTLTTDPKLSKFLMSYHSKKLDISAGDFTSALSPLTLNRSTGVKLESRLGRISLVGLVGSSQKTFEGDLYGLRGSANLTDNLELATNYVQGNKGQNSAASLEAEFTLSPEITLSGEYGWSSYEEEETESKTKRGNAFRVGASVYSEKLSLDGSYERTGDNFFSVTNTTLLNGQEEYDVSLDYSFTDYINGMLYYNQYNEHLSEQGDIFRYSLADASLSFSFPKLPSLTLSYDIFENFSSDDSEVVINDTADTFTIGLSYPIKKVRLSVSHSRSDYKDRTEFPSQETTMSNTYGISAPWGRYLAFSVKYGTSDTKDVIALNTTKYRYVTLGVEYKIIPNRLSFSTQCKICRNKDIENTINNRKIATALSLSYYPTEKNVVQLGYVLTDEDNFISTGVPASDSKNIYLTSRYHLTKNQSLEFRYSLASGADSSGGTTGSENQSVHLAYSYRF